MAESLTECISEFVTEKIQHIIIERNNAIKEKNEMLEYFEELKKARNDYLTSFGNAIIERDQVIIERDQFIKQLDEVNTKKNDYLKYLKDVIKERDETNNNLKEKEKEVSELKREIKKLKNNSLQSSPLSGVKNRLITKNRKTVIIPKDKWNIKSLLNRLNHLVKSKEPMLKAQKEFLDFKGHYLYDKEIFLNSKCSNREQFLIRREHFLNEQEKYIESFKKK